MTGSRGDEDDRHRVVAEDSTPLTATLRRPGVLLFGGIPHEINGSHDRIADSKSTNDKISRECNESAGWSRSAFPLHCLTLTVYSVNPFSFICSAFLKSAMPVFIFRNLIVS